MATTPQEATSKPGADRSGLPNLNQEVQQKLLNGAAEQADSIVSQATKQATEIIHAATPKKKKPKKGELRASFVSCVDYFQEERARFQADPKRDDDRDEPLLNALHAVVESGRAAQSEMTLDELSTFGCLDHAYGNVVDRIKQGAVRIFENFLWTSWGQVLVAFGSRFESVRVEMAAGKIESVKETMERRDRDRHAGDR